MTEVDVKKLAALARIAVSDEEVKEFEGELPAILDFVDQVQQAHGETKTERKTGDHYNIMREDSEPHQTGAYAEDLIAAMPASKEGYLQVKKIIKQD